MIDKWFYIVFNSYYKHGNFKNDHPTWTVGGIFTFAVFTIILTLTMIYGFITGDYKTPDTKRYGTLEPSPGKVMLLIGFVIIYFSFFYKKRHLQIYEKYKEDEFLNSVKAKRIAFLLVILVYLLPIIVPIFVHKVILKTP